MELDTLTKEQTHDLTLPLSGYLPDGDNGIIRSKVSMMTALSTIVYLFCHLKTACSSVVPYYNCYSLLYNRECPPPADHHWYQGCGGCGWRGSSPTEGCGGRGERDERSHEELRTSSAATAVYCVEF